MSALRNRMNFEFGKICENSNIDSWRAALVELLLESRGFHHFGTAVAVGRANANSIKFRPQDSDWIARLCRRHAFEQKRRRQQQQLENI